MGGGGVCSASSFRGTLDEPRRDNDANHERDWGGTGVAGLDVGPGASGVGLVGSGSEAGGSPALFVEGGSDWSYWGASGITLSELKVGMANEESRHAARGERTRIYIYTIRIESIAYHYDLIGATRSLRSPVTWNLLIAP